MLSARMAGAVPQTASDIRKLTERVAEWQIKNFTYQKEGNLHVEMDTVIGNPIGLFGLVDENRGGESVEDSGQFCQLS